MDYLKIIEQMSDITNMLADGESPGECSPLRIL